MNKKLSFLVLLVLTLVSCSGIPTEDESSFELPEVVLLATDTPPPAPTTPPFSAETQRVEFNAEDGTTLIGYYYPAPVVNAPVVVLMHWAPGDQKDWTNIGMVDWLTHKKLDGFAGEFPSMPYAVFTFDFRGFGESGGQFDPAGWLMDAKAAYETAQSLPGIDPTKIAGIGSSIGADAVVDACGNICKGALSLSPGGYLNIPYKEAVALFNQNTTNRVNIRCIASEGDRESAPACQSATGEFYESVIYPGNLHGTEFLTPNSLQTEITRTISEWLATALE